jgi:DNA polymerase
VASAASTRSPTPEIRACHPWLDAEIRTLDPAVIVCLGATAAQALLGATFKVTERRGEIIEAGDGQRYLATVHPSSVLRAPDDDRRRLERQRLIDDLRVAARFLTGE